MTKILKDNWPLFILLILALLTRFLFLSYPAEVVFDEVHFGKFVSAYFIHQYYFDIHPPLGKLMIAGFAKIFGFQGNFDFSKIGEVFDAQNLFILRFLPALFGVLFVLLIYKFVLLLGLSKKAAFLAGFLISFDNAFLVESKFILVDIFLLFFGFLSLYFFLACRQAGILARQKQKIIYYILAAFFAGLALSIKWTGLSFLGIILLFIFINPVRNPPCRRHGVSRLGRLISNGVNFLKRIQIKQLLIKLTIFIFVPFIVYLSFFAIHFNLLPKSGPGDAFMSLTFQKTLSGNTVADSAIKPLTFWQKFVELNQKMYFYSSTLKTGHQDTSRWYQWPLMKKPVWYWTKNLNNRIANIYLIGNPLIWWLVAVILPITFFILFFKKIKGKIFYPAPSSALVRWPPIIYLLLLGYFVNLLPFIFISRAAFLYHYLITFTFGILIFVLLIEKLLKNNFFYFSFLFLVILNFLFILPLTYGFPVSSGINDLYQGFIKFIH